MWTQESYEKALMFAAKAHVNQVYTESEKVPYLVHLVEVSIEVIGAISETKEKLDWDLAVQVALLHDCIEDTEITYEELLEKFGIYVANGVKALTKDGSLPKEKQMDDSLTRIIAINKKEIAIVKLADRISNLQKPLPYWTLQQNREYQNESRVILRKLSFASQYLAQRLENKIANYLTV